MLEERLNYPLYIYRRGHHESVTILRGHQILHPKSTGETLEKHIRKLIQDIMFVFCDVCDIGQL